MRYKTDTGNHRYSFYAGYNTFGKNYFKQGFSLLHLKRWKYYILSLKIFVGCFFFFENTLNFQD